MSEAAKIQLLLRRGILPQRILEPETEVTEVGSESRSGPGPSSSMSRGCWCWRSPEGSRLPSAKPSRRSGRTYERLPSLPARNDHSRQLYPRRGEDQEREWESRQVYKWMLPAWT